MKCKGKNGGEQHEMIKSASGAFAKFCGECGEPGAPEPTEMRKCGACDHELMTKSKFCDECGAEATTTVEELDRVAAQLADFAKANLGKTDEAPLAIEDIDVDDTEVSQILAKAAVTDENGNDGIDATPVIAEMLKAEQGTQAFLERLSARIDARLAAIASGLGLTMKANALMGTMLKAQAAEIAKYGAAPTGRRTVQMQVAGDRTEGPTPGAAIGELANLGGEDLLAKAASATARDGSLLSSHEYSKLEGYCNSGWRLGNIVDEDPELGARVVAAVQPTQH